MAFICQVIMSFVSSRIFFTKNRNIATKTLKNKSLIKKKKGKYFFFIFKPDLSNMKITNLTQQCLLASHLKAIIVQYIFDVAFDSCCINRLLSENKCIVSNPGMVNK